MEDIQQPEAQINSGEGTPILNPLELSKRQRRPSVRLGDIGVDPLYDSHSRRYTHKPRDPNPSAKPSKTRPLTNLTSSLPQTLHHTQQPNTKKRASVKRIRSNWVSRFDSAGEDLDDGYREFDAENSDSMENLGVDEGLHHRRSSDTDARDWNDGEDGVRVWLNGLGLGRYAPVFQVHEVDDEVLPMLTLEDLKDMGITAVGTRRKMYSAIQKLGKGFS